jgi:hypothetical protein
VVAGCELLVEQLVDRRVHGLVERLSRVADELHVRLRLKQLFEVLETSLVLELDKVLGSPGRDDVYLLRFQRCIGICARPVEEKFGPGLARSPGAHDRSGPGVLATHRVRLMR